MSSSNEEGERRDQCPIQKVFRRKSYEDEIPTMSESVGLETLAQRKTLECLSITNMPSRSEGGRGLPILEWSSGGKSFPSKTPMAAVLIRTKRSTCRRHLHVVR